jgi:8-oxo-dGTP diphosphatase
MLSRIRIPALSTARLIKCAALVSAMRRVSLIIFYTEEGRILLQDRKGISKAGETWAYFGGGIEEGETPEQALVRETREELDYSLTDYEFIGVITTTDRRGTVERHVYMAPFPGFGKLHQMEGSNMQLFTLAEAKVAKSVFGDDKVIEKLESMGWPPR